jgi:hypothetical protein
MTDLQTSLMAIGGAIVVGVISYNKWQEFKARRTVERAFSSAPEDGLMRRDPAPGEDRVEPVFGASDKDADPMVSTDPVVSSVDGALDSRFAAPMAAELPVDPMVDCLIPLSLEAPLRGDKLIPVLQSLRHVGNKPVHFIGQNEDGNWEPVVHGVLYYGLQAGVQLANRGNALNEIEYSELVSRLRQVADEINAEPDLPDMMRVMSAARELHQFVAEYDAQLSVNLQARAAPWTVSTLLAALERQGFDLRPDGRLVMPDGEGGYLFSISTNAALSAETTSRLTFLLDVPRVAASRDGYGAMVACARSLASRLEGNVVDDAGQPLTDAALSEIAGQVAAFYGAMDTAEVPAGSTRALRLFS